MISWQRDPFISQTVGWLARRAALPVTMLTVGLLSVCSAFAGDAFPPVHDHDAPVHAVAVTPDGERVLTASGDGTVRVWSARDGKIQRTLSGHKAAVKTVAVSSNGRFAATGGEDTTIRLWNLETGRVERILRGHFDTVTGLAFSPEGQRLVSAGLDEAVMLWDVETGEVLRMFADAPEEDGEFVPLQPALAVAFSPNGNTVASAHGKTLKLWDTDSGKRLHAFTQESGGIHAVLFSPDGETVAFAGQGGSLHFASASTGELETTLPGHDSGVTSLAFSPDGKYLLSAGHDGTVRVWKDGQASALKVLKGHTGPVSSVAFSPDGSYAVSGGVDHTARKWDMTPFIAPKVAAENPELQTAPPEAGTNQHSSAPPPEMKADTDPPKIVITSHAVTRGIVLVPALPETFVEGRATDASGIARVLVNGQPARIDVSGNFSADVPLQAGTTKIEVMAEDTHGNMAWEKFWVKNQPPDAGLLAKTVPPEIQGPENGGYHALVIGINSYRHLPPLQTAVHDAREVERLLREQYGFTTTLLIDPGRDAIMDAFNHIRNQLNGDDSFLIYYAGHGHFDKTVNKAYWLPVDARPESDTKWIIVDNITSNIRRMAARHVLVVADSCYSGTLTRSAITRLTTAEEKQRFLEKMHRRTSRTLMASGGNEPVADGGGGGHSVFARAFIEALRNPESAVFTAEQLFHAQIKERVAGSAQQVPEYNIIKNSGHEGGDFVFIKK